MCTVCGCNGDGATIEGHSHDHSHHHHHHHGDVHFGHGPAGTEVPGMIQERLIEVGDAEVDEVDVVAVADTRRVIVGLRRLVDAFRVEDGAIAPDDNILDNRQHLTVRDNTCVASAVGSGDFQIRECQAGAGEGQAVGAVIEIGDRVGAAIR